MTTHRKKITATCLLILTLCCAGTVNAQPAEDLRTSTRESLGQLVHYLELDGRVSPADIDELTDLKLKASSPKVSKEKRQAAYEELFSSIYRLQGNAAPEKEVAAALTNFAQTAANTSLDLTPEASGWSTATTPRGKLGHVEKIGNGPIPLILIPNQEGWEVFRSFMQKHADKFTMYAVTLPGFGGTPPPPRPEFMDFAKLGWWRNAEDAVVNLIDEQKIDKPVIAGVMYGGYLAARLALDHPEKLRAAVIVNGLLYPNDPMPLAERQKQAKEGLAAFPSSELIPWAQRPSAQAVREKIEGRPEALAQVQNWARDVETAKGLVIAATVNNHPASVRYGSELLTTDLSEDLRKLSVPLLVVPALSDKDAPYQGKIALTQFEEWKAKNPAAPLTIEPMQGVRQYVLFEAEDKLGQEIGAFAAKTQQADQAEAQIPAEAQKRLDHHIGKWDIRMDYIDGKGKVVYSTTGTDEARYLIDRRVVELTTSIPDLPSFSKAWVFYSIPEKTFYVTSVDAKGEFWIMSGGLDEYVITSRSKRQPDGSEIIIRFTHAKITPNSFEALMEHSKDQGKTWNVGFKQYLTRQGT